MNSFKFRGYKSMKEVIDRRAFIRRLGTAALGLGFGVSDEEHVSFFFQVLPPQKLPDQWHCS
jgi:hypothetical protein